MNMEGMTVGGEKKPQIDFNASCVSILSENDPLDNMESDDVSVSSMLSDMESIAEDKEFAPDCGSFLDSDSDFSESESDADDESESQADEEEKQEVPEPKSQEPQRKRGFLARMASSDSLFGGHRGGPPRKPDGAPRRGFLARMASSDSLFGGGRGAPPRKPDGTKANRRGLLSRMGSSDSLFGGIPSPFARRAESHKPHGSKTRRGGRRNRGGTKKEEEEPTRGVNRHNTEDSLVPDSSKAVRRSTKDSVKAVADADKPMPQPTRTRRGGRRNRGGTAAEEQGRDAPAQRGVVRNNTSDSLVQSTRSRRGGRRNRAPSKEVTDNLLDSPTEGESCSESSTLLEMSCMIET